MFTSLFLLLSLILLISCHSIKSVSSKNLVVKESSKNKRISIGNKFEIELLSQSEQKMSKATDNSFLSKIKEYQKPLRIFTAICVWYYISAVYNVYNKKALTALGNMPWTIATIQMGTGIFIILPLWFLGLRENPLPNKTLNLKVIGDIIDEYKEASLFQTITHASGVMALGLGAVSFTQIVKASEPFFTAVLSIIFLKKGLTFSASLTLIPIVFGVILSSVTELSFSWACLIAGVFANIFSAARVIRMKQQQNQAKQVTNQTEKKTKLSTENYYSILTILSFMLLVPVTYFLEGKQIHNTIGLLQDVITSDKSSMPGLTFDKVIHGYRYALVSGILFYIYNELSFSVLAEVSPITHAICNTLKRVVVIVASILFLGDKFTPLKGLGALISMIGVFLYSIATNPAITKKPEEKPKSN